MNNENIDRNLVPSMSPQPRADSDAAEPTALGTVVPLGFSGDDAALVAGLCERQPVAMAAFYERYSAYVERIITHVIGYDCELADIVQEVFLQALRSVHRLDNPRALPRWLSVVATTTARKVLRTRARRSWLRLFSTAEEESSWERPDEAVEESTLLALRAVYAILDGLPTNERIAFSLRYIEGMELTEVASACSTSLSTAKRRLRRAEQAFVVAARNRPELSEWLAEGARWTNR